MISFVRLSLVYITVCKEDAIFFTRFLSKESFGQEGSIGVDAVLGTLVDGIDELSFEGWRNLSLHFGNIHYNV